jgi:prepilin-type N-terminal cleavage/methylation domain-containing protein
MKNPMPGRGQRGFTLIEMLVVMALMLALVAIGIPSLQNALHQSKMRGMVQEIAIALRLARIDAIKTSSQGIVQIVPSTGPGVLPLVRAFSDRNSDGRLDATDPVLASFYLPTGVSFEDNAGKLDKDSVEGFSTDPAGGPSIAIFKGDGTIVEPGKFRISDPYGNYMEVYVKPPKATARIEVRKFENGEYVPNGDKGNAWTWN